MEDDNIIPIIYSTPKGKIKKYINIDPNKPINHIYLNQKVKPSKNPLKGIMKKLMIAGVALPLMYSGVSAFQDHFSFKDKKDKIVSYSNVLPYNLPKSIEQRVNKNVEYITKYKSYAIESELSKVSKFEDIIETASKKTGLSKYLLMSIPAVEAGGEIDILRAESPKGAVGPAQFMPNTAKEMGINIDNYEDERMSPSIALPAMAEYLDDRIDQFGGNVHLGLAAYNWGPGNVESLLNSPNKKDEEFIDRLPRETRNFIIRVLSRETLMRKNMVSYEKQPLFSVMIADAEDHIIKEGETLYDIAGAYDTNLEDLLELNPIKNPNKVKPGQKIKVKRGHWTSIHKVFNS